MKSQYLDVDHVTIQLRIWFWIDLNCICFNGKCISLNGQKYMISTILVGTYILKLILFLYMIIVEILGRQRLKAVATINGLIFSPPHPGSLQKSHIYPDWPNWTQSINQSISKMCRFGSRSLYCALETWVQLI